MDSVRCSLTIITLNCCMNLAFSVLRVCDNVEMCLDSSPCCCYQLKKDRVVSILSGGGKKVEVATKERGIVPEY